MAEPSPKTLLPFDGVVGPSTMRLRWCDDRVVVEFVGEIDLAAQPRAHVIADLLARWPQTAILDASGVAFIDAAGLECVLSMAGRSGSVLVLDPSPAFRQLLELLALAGVGPSVAPAGFLEQALVLHAGARPAAAGRAGLRAG